MAAGHAKEHSLLGKEYREATRDVLILITYSLCSFVSFANTPSGRSFIVFEDNVLLNIF